MLDVVHEELEECCGDLEDFPEGEKEEKSVSLPPTKQQHQALALTTQISHEAGLVDEQLLGRLRVMQRLLREGLGKISNRSPLRVNGREKLL